MDKNLVDFWREYLAAAAESQKVMESMTAWMRNGLSGAGEIASAVRKTCGVDPVTKSALDCYEFWEKAQQDFRKSLVNSLGIIGFVPREDHLSLVKRYESLKEKVASQQETIEHLRLLISEEKRAEHQEMTGKVQGLVQQQAEQFRQLMDAFGKSFKPVQYEQPEKAPEPEKKREKKKEAAMARK